jgi:phosphoribosylformylglycinamidine synthase
VRQGKFFEVELKAGSEKEAHEKLDAMCRQLLANTVIENYAVELE